MLMSFSTQAFSHSLSSVDRFHIVGSKHSNHLMPVWQLIDASSSIACPIVTEPLRVIALYHLITSHQLSLTDSPSGQVGNKN